MSLFEGFLSGLLAGILMGLLSHGGFRAGIFKSSLFMIDGSFTLKSIRKQYNERRSVLLGIPVHLLTSISFGFGYSVFVDVMHLDPTDWVILALYVSLLWVSMLLVALPVAGHGFLGNKLGTATWFEQLLLHIIFGIGLYATLHLLK